MTSLYQQALQIIAQELDKDAKSVLQECIQEITYQHDTRNLYDSYGYGIYIEGKLSKTGFLSSSMATKGKQWYGETLYGRSEIESYLRSDYRPQGVIDLAVAAAMPYAKVLEDGSGGLHQSYRVISMSFQKLQQLAYKYGGQVKAIRK